MRHEFVHLAARRLVKTHDRLVLEDLNITGMAANRRPARAISDAGRAELARIIDYQQHWHGGQVVYAGRWYPSSKTCSRCHTVVAVLPLSQRIFACPVPGYTANRDVNAAANLATRAEDHARSGTRRQQARPPTPPEGKALTRAFAQVTREMITQVTSPTILVRTGSMVRGRAANTRPCR